MVFFWSCIALSGSVFTFWCTTTDSPSTLPFTSVSNFYPTFRSPSTTQFKPGIYPCLNSANHAFLALQGHIRRVTHSFKHVSPWVSLLLILSGDVSINPSPGTRVLTGSLINIRSIKNKSTAFEDFINSNKSDVIAVTETCLRPGDTDSFIADVALPGYKYTHVPHSEERGGGVGFFICDDIDFKVLPQPCVNTFEYFRSTVNGQHPGHYFSHLVQASQCLQSQVYWGIHHFC